MIVNKWLNFAMSVVGVLTAGAASLDWTSVLSQKGAAGVATGIFVVKSLINVFAPAAGTTPTPTGGTIVTHN